MDTVKDSWMERGCHKLASDHADFPRDELVDFIENKFWLVSPYRSVRNLQALQLSPAAVKEECDRCPRVMCDHAFSPINETTLQHAPPEAMQFGGTLHRIMRAMHRANPKHGPVRLAKHDIKDGFCRMHPHAEHCPWLAIVLPRCEEEERLVATPLSCTVGWTKSPPTFCTMSETAADVANARFAAAPRSCQSH